MTAHYFIGIKVSEFIRAELSKWQDILSDSMDYKDWTATEDFHITLKFLGGCSDNTIEEYHNRLTDFEWPSSFTLSIGPAGYFGDRKQPRVFHAQVEKPSELSEIKLGIDQIGEELGFQTEKRTYHPHVTLAKKKAEGTSPLSLEQYDSLLDEHYHMDVEQFSIFRIHPGQMPKYEVAADISLKTEV
ncbi:RNA 2',3'-cyclic phosphodiesterase [Halobacillus sp. BBL2006]|uniref:RNA 2',3'-cyclic phosphodiesterase n=1 Tax=Halobacillus sp. BBL2006 TaxID=1543706 RepID=UPI000541982D|nr:RNA 2',3'-cyclic phosphodiesterase [Halobacillus sp. BBL2006]KHE69083.1 hypothetical protein LD39_13430 [Halobacillus sp. BBL2006]